MVKKSSIAIVLSFVFINIFSNSDYLKEVLDQTKNIDFTLEKIGQAINSGYIKVKDKNKAKNYILLTRNAINKILEDDLNYSKLLIINKNIIYNLKEAIKSNFLNSSSINYSHLINNNLKDLNNQELDNILLENEKILNNIVINLKNIGLSNLNLLARKSNQIIKNSTLVKKLKFLIQKSSPYFGLASYLFYINRKEDIKNLPFIGKYLSEIKDKVGTADYKTKNNEAKELNEVKDDRSNYEPGFISDNLKMASNILSFETPKPIINLSIATYMACVMKKDAQDAFKWSLEKLEDFNNLLKGEKLKDRSIVKKSESNFDSIVGYDSLKKELNSIVSYFKNKDLFELAGQKIPTVYLVNGQLSLANDMIKALAGEITKAFKNSSGKFCGIHNFNITDLIEKDIKDIKEVISKIEDFDAEHCIIVLNNIDWLYNHAKNKTKPWSKLTELIKTIKTKKKISIFVTTEDYKIIDNSILESFECLININNPEKSEIKEFLTKFFKDRAINNSNFNLDLLAEKTETMSYEKIKFILNKAISNAYIENRVVNQEDIEKALN